jgi:hypothetical protein
LCSDVVAKETFVKETISGAGQRFLVKKEPCSNMVNMVSSHALVNSVNQGMIQVRHRKTPLLDRMVRREKCADVLKVTSGVATNPSDKLPDA